MADTATTGPEPERGSAAGLMAFLDYAISRGDMNANTAGAYKAACKEILSAAEGQNWEATDVTALDVDDACRRFETLRAMKFQPDSLRTYQSRFRSSVTMYLEWLDNPTAWRPPRANRTAKPKDVAPRPQAKATATGSTPATSLATAAAAPGMIPYPFPLRTDVLVTLNLPPDLTKKEAKRLSVFIESLAIEEQLALPRGEQPEPESAAFGSVIAQARL